MALASSPNYRLAARRIARRIGIDPNLFYRQINQESGFDPRAQSGAGAQGIAQIVPRWHPDAPDPYHPLESLNWAANYDATLLKKYGGDWRKVLSVYNSGNPNVDNPQTVNYVRSIMGGSPPAAQSGLLPGLAEAFYDPLGSYDTGGFGGAIGGHSDHVHLSVTDPQSMLSAIRYAQQLGMRVSENPYVGSVDKTVHVGDSFHYRDFPGLYGGKTLGEGIDVSGSPAQMAQLYRWATSGAPQVAGQVAGQSGNKLLAAASIPSNVPSKPVVLYNAPVRTTQQVLGAEGGPYAAPGKAAPAQTSWQQQLALLIQDLRRPQPNPYGASASQYATQAVNMAVNPLLAAQTSARTAATANAAEINKAALAAAELLKSLGVSTQAAYQSAADEQTARAQGFSGDLRDTAAAEAARSQAMLASVPGNTQVVDDKASHLASLLYGLSGELPGRTLGEQGVAAVAAANTIPGKTVAFGQEQANAALGAGEQAAQQYTLPIAQAAAQYPAYLQDFSTQAATARQRDISNVISLAKLGQTTSKATALQLRPFGKGGLVRFNPATGKTTIVRQPDAGAGGQAKVTSLGKNGYTITDPKGNVTWYPPVGGASVTYKAFGDTLYRIDPSGPVAVATKSPKPTKKTRDTFTDKTTNVRWESVNGGPWHVIEGTGKGPLGKPKVKAPGYTGLTGEQQTTLQNETRDFIQTLHDGKAAQYTTINGVQTKVPGTGVGRTSYQKALRKAILSGPKLKTGAVDPVWRKVATDLTNAIYNRGEAGRPLTSSQQASRAMEIYQQWIELPPDDPKRSNEWFLSTLLRGGVFPRVAASVIPGWDEIVGVGTTGSDSAQGAAGVTGAPLVPWNPKTDPITKYMAPYPATRSGRLVDPKTGNYVVAPVGDWDSKEDPIVRFTAPYLTTRSGGKVDPKTGRYVNRS